jgi:GNAT superfamily N-acetyltransferase
VSADRRAVVTRTDDGLALRALRLGVSPRALVVHVGTDVVVRTPSRPSDLAGNVVDLLEPPTAESLPALIGRVRRLMEPVGVAFVHIRFELPVDRRPPPDLIEAAGELGARLQVQRVAEVVGAASVPGMRVGIERLAPPTAEDPVGARRWYAAGVLARYAHGTTPEVWRTFDAELGAWHRERLAALAALGRADVWVATTQGMPVASLSLLRDLDGLATLEDLVTHPAHRGRGLATTLLMAALAFEQHARPAQRIVVALPAARPASGSAGSAPRPVADVHSLLLRPPG